MKFISLSRFFVALLSTFSSALILNPLRLSYHQLLRLSGPAKIFSAVRDCQPPSALLMNTSEETETETKASIRFSGVESIEGDETSSAVDTAVSWLSSDIGSISLGLLGLTLLLVARLLESNISIEGLGQETRSNLLAVLACGAVLVNGISKLDVESALAETVVLQGSELKEPLVSPTVTDNDLTRDMKWILGALLAATPAKTAVVLQAKENPSCWVVIAVAGMMPDEVKGGSRLFTETLASTPILDRFRSRNKQETYLPTLQALPGKTEFTYMPENTQAALLIPIYSEESGSLPCVAVLGSNQARSFTPRDIAWCLTAAARLRSV